MSTSNLGPNDGINERDAEKVDADSKLPEEIHDAGSVLEEAVGVSSWGARLRALVGKFGAEEGGIERVPPEARTDQHPRGMDQVGTS